ncbi:MAG: single-stranded DNA-binding protein [Chloroflexi bacterium]|nr:MAG: single-stranded DNA-binding protein [Chloroflexota bacterium]
MPRFLKVFAIGRLGRNAEIVTTQNGNEFIKFSLAVDTRNGTSWYSCMLRHNTYHQNVLPYLQKGKQILAEGELEATAFIDQTGNPRPSLTLWLDSVTLLGSPNDTPTGDADLQQHLTPEYNQDEDYELPF